MSRNTYDALKNEFSVTPLFTISVNTVAVVFYLLRSVSRHLSGQALSRSPKDNDFHAMLSGTASQAKLLTHSALRAFTSLLEQSSSHILNEV